MSMSRLGLIKETKPLRECIFLKARLIAATIIPDLGIVLLFFFVLSPPSLTSLVVWSVRTTMTMFSVDVWDKMYLPRR